MRNLRASHAIPVLLPLLLVACSDFDLDAYCSDLGCDMPACELAIFEDEAFDDWLWDTDEEDDILASCF